ncbi:replication-relaxation family protein [Bacillus sp. FJAT-45350]|uniref:replication-relaxation family protein n=1 Tax=Bacillus sp. FJAT-45350 TaxID=2011014 RepID=UPI000BB9AE88|nr:replication-relaxation family protein [Bacillus sp. FJAT-45350]
MTDVWNGQLIRLKQVQILIFLYYVRGATNDQIRRYLYSHCTSKRATQLANTSKFISGLKKMGFINSASCHPYNKGEMNYLTAKAIEYLLESEKIMVSAPESNDSQLGFDIDGVHGTFEYSMLKPPLQFIEHHIMTVDFYLKYVRNTSFRHNLYCVRSYKYVDIEGNYSKNGKLKPDGEILNNTGSLIALEVDTGSERYKDLVKKFENYKRYFDYCVENDIKVPYIAILFYTKRFEDNLPLEEDKRYQTILKAAVEGLKYYCHEVVIMLKFKDSYLKNLMQEKKELLNNLGISIPSKTNPIEEKMQRKQEEEKRKEEERRREEERIKKAAEKRKIEEERKRQLEIKKEKERQMHLQAERQRLLEEEEKKKKGLFGKFFG